MVFARGESDVVPDGAQGDEEGAVHDAFQVRCQSHAHIGEAWFGETCEQAEQEQKHAMPHHTPTNIFHVCITSLAKFFVSGKACG